MTEPASRAVRPGRPRVLLSAHTRALLGERIAADHFDLLALEDVAPDPAATVDVVFISRDITGRSSKTVHTPMLEACLGVIRRSPQLAWVHTHSAGADRPIYPELRARGVLVSTSSGANAKVVAQTALAALLALSRRFPALMAAQAQRRWAPLVDGPLPRDLAGQTVVLLGWGPIAQTLQPLLAALGLHTVVVRRSGSPAAAGLETVGFERLHSVLPRADWLVLACPLTPQTQGLIDAAALRLLPPGAQLINVARGEVVVEADLIAALQAGMLAGAFLDVFAQEPLPPASPLWALPGVMLTPHAAGHSDGNEARVAHIFLANLHRWQQGLPLQNAVT
ncbi:MAG: D-2-hydroxyacid dehydrogenase [Rubrivivax sp.]|nr:D-2-hydroxyacid dehydrogenase [Rubrivivax sp.]